MWWRGKRFGRWQEPRDADFWRGMTGRRLVELREIVCTAYNQKYAGRGEFPVGFVPRTFALWALDRASVYTPGEIGTGAELLIRSYALYQRIQIADGSWEDGPGEWRTLAAVYPDPQEVQ